MQQVKIESHYATPIFLDQCLKCGGLWFDGMELFRARQGEAQKVESVDVGKLCQPTPIEQKVLRCPKDEAALTLFHDPNFPKSILVESCPVCGGFWFNRCEFVEFQEEREKLEKAPKKKEGDAQLQQDIEKLLELHSKKSSYDALGKLGTFLSTPVDRNAMRPLGLSDRQQKTVDIILAIVSVLLRLLLRR